MADATNGATGARQWHRPPGKLAIGCALLAATLCASAPALAQDGGTPPKSKPKAAKADGGKPGKSGKADKGGKDDAAAAGPKTRSDAPTSQPSASSLIEDRAARKLLVAGDSRMQLEQPKEAVELYEQVIERYPRSAVRFEAFDRLGQYHLLKAKDAGKALPYFERAADPECLDDAVRGDGMLNIGRCYYEQQKYPQAFAALRAAINAFPGTELSNQAYFYIGDAHYKLGAYNRAIEAFSKVGTAVTDTERGKKQMEIGKRLFVRLSDVDLISLPAGQAVTALVETSGGDKETVTLGRVGTATSVNYIGEVDTTLGEARPGNNVLEMRGTDTVNVTYIDAQTSAGKLNVPLTQTLSGVSNAIVDFMDGAFRDPLKSVVIGKTAYVRVVDYDRDLTPQADTVTVKVLAKRRIGQQGPSMYEDAPEEPAQGEKKAQKTRADAAALAAAATQPDEDENKPKFEIVDEVTLTLTERPRPLGDGQSAPSSEAGPIAVHSGVFGGQVPVLPGDVVKGDPALQVQVGDILEVQYTDELNTTGKPVLLVGTVPTVHGSLGEPKVANQSIKDLQLELQTRLKKAEALTNIGRIYKQLGLKEQADQHFQNGVKECEDLSATARNLGGEVLETMYVRLWKLYIELDELDKAASMCLALQREFPNSQFVDEALIGLGETAIKKKDYTRAIGILKRVLDLQQSSRKADALFNIGLCQEAMAQPKTADEKPNQQLMEQAFVSFQKVFQQYPQSGVAGDSVGKMADFFMASKDYDRAVSTFQQALDEYPDAQFTDRVLYDYGRCLYRMKRQDEALAKFRQLMSEYPQSKLSGKAKQIVTALEKRAASGE